MVGCLLSPLPITALKPCTLRGPGLGMDVDVFDDEGNPIREGIGHLVLKQPAPSRTKSLPMVGAISSTVPSSPKVG